ncbi:hypothetical protein TgHK011_002316 [Trichoderma gracile]|nr:hypothetical protein TgHK011_002316 [Trichoderma gracile]
MSPPFPLVSITSKCIDSCGADSCRNCPSRPVWIMTCPHGLCNTGSQTCSCCLYEAVLALSTSSGFGAVTVASSSVFDIILGVQRMASSWRRAMSCFIMPAPVIAAVILPSNWLVAIIDLAYPLWSHSSFGMFFACTAGKL